MPLINVKNITVTYGKHKVIDSLSFSLEEGDFLCIVGPNGSGKSTLLKAILGEAKIHSGNIILNKELKRNFIGYLPQHNNIPEDFPATVNEIVYTGLLNQTHFVSSKYKKRANVTLKTLGISSLKNDSYSNLSGGQRQKILLARALCATSKLLILDEASNNLDYNSKSSFYTLLKKINKAENLTIIMVTHDLDHKNLLGNKILFLDHDSPFFGSTDEYVRRIHAH